MRYQMTLPGVPEAAADQMARLTRPWLRWLATDARSRAPLWGEPATKAAYDMLRDRLAEAMGYEREAWLLLVEGRSAGADLGSLALMEAERDRHTRRVIHLTQEIDKLLAAL